MADVLTGAVEVRASDAGPMLHGVVLTEGRASSGGRRELFAPLSTIWPPEGIAILAVHRSAPEVRAVPTREPNGEIRIAVRATDTIRRAVDIDGRRFMSVEFHALEERTTSGGVREVLRAVLTAAALVPNPEYDTTRAEVRRSRRTRVWL